MPLADFEQRTPFFGKQRFIYEAEADQYRCPGGAVLHWRTHLYTDRVSVYRAGAATCDACALKAQCTDSASGRTLRRHFDEEYWERGRGYHQTAAYAKAMRKRQGWVEPLFAEAKAWHRGSRFRLRTLPKVNIEGVLVAAGQNLKRLVQQRGWGRRPGPTGAPLIIGTRPTRSLMGGDQHYLI
jgi:transposase